MVNFHLTLRKQRKEKSKISGKKENFKKRKKNEISASEFMPAASLASLADFQVSNFKILKIPKKMKFSKKLNSQKNEILKILKFPKNEILKILKFPKNEILKKMKFSKK